ncbi:hypothetical protein LMOSLCC2378_1722 [Listeria monocytogenes SLCC2378]|nr:hypothetical protein LMOATCC19117_1716 [Listeria monocytogenes ATCC 19117]CBY73489.1 hypothetical protein LMOSLCC2378_1722 [Listeria monocytogenes SLCC2378]
MALERTWMNENPVYKNRRDFLFTHSMLVLIGL